MIIQANKETFHQHIESQAIVDFFTSGCPSCEKFAPIFEREANENNDYKFVQVDLDDDITLAEQYGITHVPTIIKFVGGKPVQIVEGGMEQAAFTQFIKEG